MDRFRLLVFPGRRRDDRTVTAVDPAPHSHDAPPARRSTKVEITATDDAVTDEIVGHLASAFQLRSLTREPLPDPAGQRAGTITRMLLVRKPASEPDEASLDTLPLDLRVALNKGVTFDSTVIECGRLSIVMIGKVALDISDNADELRKVRRTWNAAVHVARDAAASLDSGASEQTAWDAVLHAMRALASAPDRSAPAAR